MEIYFFVWMLIIGCVLYLHIGKFNNMLYTTCFGSLFLISALRFNVGMDYRSYLKVYYFIETSVNEPGYYWLVELTRQMDLGGQAVLIVYAAVTMLLAKKTLVSESRDPMLSCFLFFSFMPFFFMSMNAVRQCLAVYVFFFAIRYIQQREWKKYYTCILLGILFGHFTLCIALPLYFVLQRRLSLKTKLILSAIVLGSGSLVIMAAQYSRYAIYLLVYETASTQSEAAGTPILIVFEMVVSVILYVSTRYQIKHLVYRNMNFFFLLITLFGVINSNNVLSTLVPRFAWYFMPAFLVLIPDYVYGCGKRFYQVKWAMMLCGFSIVLWWSLLDHGEINNLVPYQTFLTEDLQRFASYGWK